MRRGRSVFGHPDGDVSAEASPVGRGRLRSQPGAGSAIAFRKSLIGYHGSGTTACSAPHPAPLPSSVETAGTPSFPCSAAHFGACMPKALGPKPPVVPPFINIGQRLEGVGEKEEFSNRR